MVKILAPALPAREDRSCEITDQCDEKHRDHANVEERSGDGRLFGAPAIPWWAPVGVGEGDDPSYTRRALRVLHVGKRKTAENAASSLQQQPGTSQPDVRC